MTPEEMGQSRLYHCAFGKCVEEPCFWVRFHYLPYRQDRVCHLYRNSCHEHAKKFAAKWGLDWPPEGSVTT